MEDLHKYWKHKWINPKIEIRPSRIDGRGSFATAVISKGEVVAVNGGLVVPVAEAKVLRQKIGSLRGLQISDDFLLTVTDPEEAMFNHSCEPNVGLSDSITTIAICDIQPGEEICFCYFFSDTNFDPFTCKCGSKTCRGIVKSTGWNDNIDFQKKYAHYYSPYLRAKFLWK